MMTEPSVVAPVLSQPSLPAAARSPPLESIACARWRFKNENLSMIGLPFKSDRSVPDARFETYRRESGAADMRVCARWVEVGSDVPPDHQTHDLVVGDARGRHGRHVPTILEHGDAISDRKHLVEPMGDVQDRDLLGGGRSMRRSLRARPGS